MLSADPHHKIHEVFTLYFRWLSESHFGQHALLLPADLSADGCPLHDITPLAVYTACRYDEFSPIIRNHWRFWDAGACTVAHELGHYLGLRHTHQDDCAGNGVEAADAVPDTPANMEFWAYAHSVPAEHLNMQLAEWCTAFREGQNPRPQVQDLMKFDSCPSVNVEAVPQGDLVVDNVFNLLSYLPDACCMVLTRGQVARLHEMIVQYRPGLIAARSVGAV